MKLLSCNIENFGKISNLQINFSDGINVINEPNSWGKSTLAAFIKAMFYGFDTKRESGAFEKDRVLYRPWQGGVYGGELDFQVGNRTYRISRTFGKNDKTDSFHIYDLSTNLESVDFTERVGEELFDLDATSFKRSIFIAQNDCTSQTSDGINAKLGNLVENTNDINNYEKAQEYLKELLNKMSPTRVTGSIKKRKNELTELEQDLRAFDAAEFATEELKQHLQEAQEKKQALMKERDDCAKRLTLASEESTKIEQRRNYLVLCEQQQAKLEALVPFTDLFPQGVPKEEEITDLLKKARKLEEEQNTLRHFELNHEEREEYEELSMIFDKGEVPSDESIDKVLQAQARLGELYEQRTKIQTQLSEREKESLADIGEPKEKPSGFVIRLIFGGIFALLGIACEVAGILTAQTLSYGWYFIPGGAAAFVLGMCLILIGLRRKATALKEQKTAHREWEESNRARKAAVKKLLNQEEEKNEKIRGIQKKTADFLEKYHIHCEPKNYAPRLYELKNEAHEFNRLKQKADSQENLSNTCKELRKELLSYGKRLGWKFGEDITSDLTYLQTEATKYRLAKHAAAEVADRISEFEGRTDMERLLSDSDFSESLESINQEIHSLDERLETVRSAIDQYNRQMEDMQEQLDLRDEKREELLQCQLLQREEEHRYEILSLTQEYLQKAREQFIARYMAPISNAFDKYYSLLEGSDKQNDWMIDANVSFKKRELGELRETKWLSSGYQDLIGVCMRLALVEAMYQGEKPFLVLDDPFVNLDEEKTLRGMELLKSVAGEYQTIYFTCHSSRQPR